MTVRRGFHTTTDVFAQVLNNLKHRVVVVSGRATGAEHSACLHAIQCMHSCGMGQFPTMRVCRVVCLSCGHVGSCCWRAVS